MTTENNNDPKAIVTESLSNAAGHLRSAESVFQQAHNDSDIELINLPQAERYAYVTACAAMASAHAAIAQVQAQAILQSQQQDILAALQALIGINAPATEVSSELLGVAFPSR